MIPDEKLARWAALPRPGTPGPWIWSGEEGGERSWEIMTTEPGEDHFHVVAARPADWDMLASDPEQRDAAFLAAAPEMRQAIDELVAEVRDVREECAAAWAAYHGLLDGLKDMRR